jgi:predicted PurR-regulated permease PerM
MIAYVLDPLVDILERARIPRARAIWLVFAMALMLVLMMLATVVPRLIFQTEELIQKFPDYSRQLRLKLQDWVDKPPLGITVPTSLINLLGSPTRGLTATNLPQTNLVSSTNVSDTELAGVAAAKKPETPERKAWKMRVGETVLSWGAKVLPAIGSWFLAQLTRVASLIGLLIGLALVPVYVFYFLLEKKGIERNWTDYLPIRESWVKEEVVFVLRAINTYLILFFRGQVLVALCDGILLTSGFLLIGMPFALLLGMTAGLLSIVPYLGVMISIVPALTLAAMQFGDWLHPLLVLAVFGIVQLLEGLVISPRIMGNRVGLHPVTIIIAVMVGTTLLGGILGGVLAIPLTAALRVIMFRYVWVRREPLNAPNYECLAQRTIPPT